MAVVTGSGGGDGSGGGNDWQWWRLMLTVMGGICDTYTAMNSYVLSCSL